MIELPEVFLERMKSLLSAEDFSAFCNAYENPPVRGLRYNGLKPQKNRGQGDLSPCGGLGAEPPRSSPIVPWCSSGRYYSSEVRPSKTIAYHAGLFYIQEPSAMCPGEVLGVAAGDRVLDVCAAPGGKSVQIAGHLQGEGLLVSNDASASRSRALVKNLERAGVSNAIVLTEMPQKLAARFPQFFDKILVDAPCSGEGMFRRDTDAVKAYTANKPDACAAVQKDILRHAAQMLKPGGRMVYSTCTFNTTENENVITSFLESHQEFSLVQIQHENICVERGIGLPQVARIWPHLANGEGHFVALMEKQNHSDSANQSAADVAIPSKIPRPPAEFTDFCRDFLTIPLHQTHLTQHGINLYAQPVPLDLKGLRVARSGRFLGEIKKNRFVPSQALAMSLLPDHARHAINLSTQDAEKYLRGESLHTSEPLPATKPWVLICHENAPLGWARFVQGRLKNNLPVGWVTSS
ncbi:MAG: RsmF rRNA methyltransferase first C-terminal domain-containing protein [Defluviitaleaceae bacterium]|nr:RsmF rRNA methyltransferase first C-terminal domain-containing protein [Defluviitaleaceae bacterium]MCL2262484.1 RsmF rRNA methyltransferase first C-terminal domain-containing protein [Defluviitaleaceae bacterium]